MLVTGICCIVSYCVVLHCIVLYCIVLYCIVIVLYCIVLYYIDVLYWNVDVHTHYEILVRYFRDRLTALFQCAGLDAGTCTSPRPQGISGNSASGSERSCKQHSDGYNLLSCGVPLLHGAPRSELDRS